MAAVCVLGAGYVGLCLAASLAAGPHRVVVVDKDVDRISALEAGRSPIYEPGLDQALARARRRGRLRFSSSVTDGVRASRVSFVCVGTPSKANGTLDLRWVRLAVRQVGKVLRDGTSHLMVIKSSIVPGTTDRELAPALSASSGRPLGRTLDLVVNPEFLREGSALEDSLRPDRIVVGSERPSSAERVLRLFDHLQAPAHRLSWAGAEMVKYASNGFLAVKIAYANEMANLCSEMGVDWYEIADAVGSDARIGRRFLRAGVGFGGSCLPKDARALAAAFRRRRMKARLLIAALETNEAQPLRAIELLRREIGRLRGRRVALLGLAFKPDTDDVRETRALPIYLALRAEGVLVVAHDPKASKAFQRIAPACRIASSVQEALRGADACIVQTEWDAYRRLSPSWIRRTMKAPVIVDGRRTFSAQRMRAAGIRYQAIGLGRTA